MNENFEIRKPTFRELELISYLIKMADFSVETNWEEKMFVSTMNDGGMGSLTLYPNSTIKPDRRFGKCIATCMFEDKDGILVFPSLFVDKNYELYELDIFKGDGSRLIEIPSVEHFSPA